MTYRPPTNVALSLLDALEREEAKLLCWGVPEGAFSYEEVAAAAAGALATAQKPTDEASVWSVVQQLLDSNWLWQVPESDPPRYRTRLAEAVRLFALLRQVFAGGPDAWQGAPRLVADYRLMLRPRVFPRRDVDVREARDAINAAFDDPRAVKAVLDVLPRRTATGDATLAGFQVRAAQRVLAALTSERNRSGGTIVCAGTGSGKTLAFYLPALIALASRSTAGAWTKCLALYPRNELLKDQFREALGNVAAINPGLRAAGRRALSVGALFGGTPWRQQVANAQTGWKRGKREADSGFVCPLARCPLCTRDLLWLERDFKAKTERLVCSSATCRFTAESDEVRLTRDRMLSSPPDVLFTSTEMLNQRLASSAYRTLFGIGMDATRRPILMLLDEVHTNEGVHGAHVAMLIRRWRHLSKASPHMVGLSATLEDAQRFFADLVGIPRSSVMEVSPAPDEMMAQGSEYMLALRGDPSSGASLLSTSIQAMMLLRRVLGVSADDAVAGSRVFAFTDNLDVVNRLFHNARDAEGRTSWGAPKRNGRPLASMRATALPQHQARFAEGQSWDLVESLGHGLTVGDRLRIERTTSQDPGVQTGADVVVATAALEVGFDDPAVGAVLQHKAPRSAAGFLQRKGRAGRQRLMRPWTVVVLSDYGRDRAAYQAYEHTFAPTLAPRYLPLRNRAMLRMQATYVLFEWLSRGVDGAEPWSDLAAPAGTDEALRTRQRTYTERLRELLADEGRQREFTAYVAAALGLDRDAEASTLDALLWHPPRPVLSGAAPTLLRRLERSWTRAFAPETPDLLAKRGPPLPEFVQGTLFGDLLVPEVEIRTGADDPPTMLIAQALREFAPGRVSRRFGIEGTDTHWVDPGHDDDFDVANCCPEDRRAFLGRFEYVGEDGPREVVVFRPLSLVVAPPPPGILPSSNAFPQWKTQVLAPAAPSAVDTPIHSAWQDVVRELRFHMHQTGGPVEVRRFSPGCRTTLLRSRRPAEERRLHYVSGPERTPAALGFVADVDALEVRFKYPDALLARCAADGPLLRGLRPTRFRDLVRSDSRLDGVVNSFQREWLADAYLAALIGAATARQITPEEAAAQLERDRAALVDALERMFLWAPPAEARAQDDDADDDAPDNAGNVPPHHRPKRLDELVGAMGDPCVRASLRDAARALWQPPDETWLPWLRARYKATLAAAMLEAFGDVCPQIDASVVLEDLDVHAAPFTGWGDDRFWLTESTLGGGGAIEAFFRAYADDPRRYFRLLEAALGASDLERVAAQLERIVEHAAGAPDTPVAVGIAALRAAAGHAETLAAVDRLRSVLAARGIVADPSLMVAFSARLLRPGAGRDLDAFLSDALRAWSAHEQRLGFDIDVRVFAAMRSHDDALDRALGIVAPGDGDEAQAVWRYSALRSLLWARGGALRIESLRVTNPFVQAASCDRLLVLETLPRTAPRVELASSGWFDAVASALTTDGVVELVAGADRSAELADAMRRVGTQAIDTGGLLVHGRVAGVRREATGWVATLELPEACQ